MSKLVSTSGLTAQQGKSGLGIEAQRQALGVFANANGFQPVAEFVEVETAGQRCYRASASTSAALAEGRPEMQVVVAKLIVFPATSISSPA